MPVLRVAALAAALIVAALASRPPEAHAETVAISVTDLSYPAETNVAVGDTVRWDFLTIYDVHTTTECGATCSPPTMTPLWDSEIIGPIASYEYTFAEPGTYLYHCEVHPLLMQGTIVVGGVGGVAELPDAAAGSGQALGDDATSSTWMVAAITAAAAAMAVGLAGGAWYAWRRARR